MNANNLQIILDNGQKLDYKEASDLGIAFTRIADDFSDPTKRYGDFTYTFALPRTKNNDRIFEYPDTRGRTKIFQGKTFGCKVYFNGVLILDGIIKLFELDVDNYKCQFYSRLTEFVDVIGSTSVKDITVSGVVVDFSTNGYLKEKHIIDHIEADYADCDATTYQFPLTFYRTVHVTPDTIHFNEYARKDMLATDQPLQNMRDLYNSTFNHGSSVNRRNFMYYQQFPPAFYIVSILKAIFTHVGWSLEGNWMINPSVKKVIMLYTGSDTPTGNVNNTWVIDSYLPDTKCIDFLKQIMTFYNLYFTIDYDNKSFILNDYQTTFGSIANPYDVTKKVDADTISKSIYLDYDVQIKFKTGDQNTLVSGTNLAINSASEYDTPGMYSPNNWLGVKVDGAENYNYSPPFDSIGSFFYASNLKPNFDSKLTGSKEVNLEFGAPTLNTMMLYSEWDKFGVPWTGAAFTYAFVPISIPMLSQQTVSNNQGYKFASDSGTTMFEDNTPQSMQYDCAPTLMYYYGRCRYDYERVAWDYAYNLDKFTGKFDDWVTINIATGGTASSLPSGKTIVIPVASPYKLVNQFEKTLMFQRAYEDDIYYSWYRTIKGVEVDALLSTYFMAGRLTSNNYDTTDCHLIFCEDTDLLFDTVYSKYHRKKYSEIAEGYVFKAKMRCDENDWREMQFNRTISYNGELFRLVSLKNYDPINRTADLELLKKT